MIYLAVFLLGFALGFFFGSAYEEIRREAEIVKLHFLIDNQQKLLKTLTHEEYLEAVRRMSEASNDGQKH